MSQPSFVQVALQVPLFHGVSWVGDSKCMGSQGSGDPCNSSYSADGDWGWGERLVRPHVNNKLGVMAHACDPSIGRRIWV
jgi:hypothetical protein